jgi:hypothetical protein
LRSEEISGSEPQPTADLGAVEGRLADPGFHLEGREPDDELRESMAAGWSPWLPAIANAAGVLLVGHRRMAVANELGIKPEIHFLPPGTSREYQITLALLSNVGGKGWTPDQRREIARLLYDDERWTMKKIAEALDVSVGTVSGDLSKFSGFEKVPRARRATPRRAEG